MYKLALVAASAFFIRNTRAETSIKALRLLSSVEDIILVEQ